MTTGVAIDLCNSILAPLFLDKTCCQDKQARKKSKAKHGVSKQHSNRVNNVQGNFSVLTMLHLSQPFVTIMEAQRGGKTSNFIMRIHGETKDYEFATTRC